MNRQESSRVVGNGSARPGKASRGRVSIWAVLFGTGLIAAVVSAAVMYPPLRQIVLQPAIAVPLMAAGTGLAVLALAGALALRPPPDRAATGAILSMIVAVAVMIAFVYRLVAGSLGTPFEPALLAWWLVGAAVILVELATLAVRLRHQSRSRRVGGSG